MTIYGYVRVSTKEQNEDRQLAALAPFEIPESNLYMDKLSGKDFKRPAYRKMIRRLKPNDVQRDHGTVAHHYKGKTGGYQSVGYPFTGYNLL